MNPTQFLGEHLLIGNIGHLAVTVSVFASLFSAFAYFMAEKTSEKSWLQYGKWAFHLQSVAVLTIVITLFGIIHSHYYEYQYAWQHSSNSLPVHYMISCFWEGQEGSFLLWMFWHVVLGSILTFKAKKWEAPVMVVIALAQFMLGFMLLGIELGGQKLGSSPFELLRNMQPDVLQIPIVNRIGKENYLQAIKDGNGLNPLLQNYWMVIHPPTLFFGFAATIVPFAYAVAGVWRQQYREWIAPALPWALLAVGILGGGIIMGGFWAYESLTFGGYWAWDPVENASLIPWLVLIAGVHILLINRATSKFTLLSVMLMFATFILVLYATFLTRSGILGNASVHSFTDLGLSGQLLLFIVLFVYLCVLVTTRNLVHQISLTGSFVAIILVNIFWSFAALNIINTVYFVAIVVWMVLNLKAVLTPDTDKDNLYSREFWMFVGTLIMLLSGFQVILSTSIPVFNKLYGFQTAVPKPQHYNDFQIYFAILVAYLTAVTQFYNYRDTSKDKVTKAFLRTLLITIVLTIAAWFVFGYTDWKHLVLLFTSVYAVVGNCDYVFTVLRGRFKVAGASVAHAGFGLMLIGILASSVNKKVISYNNIGGERFIDDRDESGHVDQSKADFNRENILLVKDKPTPLANGEFVATYRRSYTVEPDKYFVVDFKRMNPETGKVLDSFVLEPNAQNNPRMGGLISNPDTRHYIARDIFTHVNYESSLDKEEEFKDFKVDTVQMKGSFLTFSSNRKVVLDSLVRSVDAAQGTIKVVAHTKVISLNDTFYLNPVFTVSNNTTSAQEAVSDKAGVMLALQKIIPNVNNPALTQFIFLSAERRPKMDYVIMKAIVFPWINLLWAGTIIMVIGFMMAVIRRFKEAKAIV